ncbi:25S rRNA (cytosine(2278)-C(5))-methyltransferase [Pseudozyma hubeiensis]|nr:25S rRNA (cytosine(2278)-C(5))-methyltransferase [Pseudozyma hubeiensis]
MADFYIRSARSLDRVLRDECSVKAAASAHADSGRVLAILVNSLAYRSALMHALDESKVMKLEEKVFTLTPPSKNKVKSNGKGKNPPTKTSKIEYPSKQALLLVLCHDLLFQSRGIQASKTWPPKVTLERYRASLHSSLIKLQIRQGKSRIQDLRSGALYQEMTARMPRWIRINSLRATREEVFDWLAENKFHFVTDRELTGVKEFAESEHVPGLLAFHPKATSLLLKSEMYRENWIVMQDLASCFPAYILDPPVAAHVIDATSAPGNKTSHLSAIMFSKPNPNPTKGRIDAFERDAVRFKTLLKRLAAVGALQTKPFLAGIAGGNVIAQRKDFLTTQPHEFRDVTHMLLDPSCSGSGIVNRLDFLKEDDDVENDTSDTTPTDTGESKLAHRLRQLSEFQQLMIRHAFKFPALEKVVYSTCSIHAEENEMVVMKALDSEEAREGGWTLAGRRDVIPSWKVRGDRKVCEGREEVAESVIRCIPGGEGDGDKPNVESCNGFFVACFVRSGERGGNAAVVETRKKRVLDDQEGVADDGDDDNDDEEEDLMQTDSVTASGAVSSGGGGGNNAAANRKKKLQKRRKKQRLQAQQE